MGPQTNTSLILTQDSEDHILSKLQFLNNPYKDT